MFPRQAAAEVSHQQLWCICILACSQCVLQSRFTETTGSRSSASNTRGPPAAESQFHFSKVCWLFLTACCVHHVANLDTMLGCRSSCCTPNCWDRQYLRSSLLQCCLTSWLRQVRTTVNLLMLYLPRLLSPHHAVCVVQQGILHSYAMLDCVLFNDCCAYVLNVSVCCNSRGEVPVRLHRSCNKPWQIC